MKSDECVNVRFTSIQTFLEDYYAVSKKAM